MTARQPQINENRQKEGFYMNKKVILIMTDTQRTDMLGCYGAGDMRTPNLDRLASALTRPTPPSPCASLPAPPSLPEAIPIPAQGGPTAWASPTMCRT